MGKMVVTVNVGIFQGFFIVRVMERAYRRQDSVFFSDFEATYVGYWYELL